MNYVKDIPCDNSVARNEMSLICISTAFISTVSSYQIIKAFKIPRDMKFTQNTLIEQTTFCLFPQNLSLIVLKIMLHGMIGSGLVISPYIQSHGLKVIFKFRIVFDFAFSTILRDFECFKCRIASIWLWRS